MTNEQANYLVHAGKKGMKWGVRKSSIPKGAIATVASGGLILGKKSKYTDPKAKALRIDAGKMRSDAMFLSAAGSLTMLGIKNSTGIKKAGLIAATALLETGAALAVIEGTRSGFQARSAQAKADSK